MASLNAKRTYLLGSASKIEKALRRWSCTASAAMARVARNGWAENGTIRFRFFVAWRFFLLSETLRFKRVACLLGDAGFG
jgi:hypothetical protein